MPEIAGFSTKWVVVGAVSVVAVYFVFRLLFGQRDAPHVKEVRSLAAQGDFLGAGRLQLKHGNLAEAFNLFVRGDHHSLASKASERMGNFAAAAEMARKAREWKRAGRLFERAGTGKEAAVCFEEVGMYVDAARVLEGHARPSEVAVAWERAFDQQRKEARSTGDDAGLDALAKIATRVSAALTAAGERARAAEFKQLTEVGALRTHLGLDAHPDGEFEIEIDTGVPNQRAARATRVDGKPEPGAVQSPVFNDHTPALAKDSDERYEVLEKLGEGGMGEVYRGRDLRLDRIVALKFLPRWVTSNDLLTRLFSKEAKLAASLNHPNIITVHDFGVMDQRPFLCMELVDGAPLTEALEGNPEGMPIATILQIGLSLFEALSYAHSRGIVHRDIKPANIMLTEDGRLKLADFGVARMGDSDKTTKIVGTPAYMAPEQLRGKGVDARTDTFAAGVTLYELITGEQPFEGMERAKAAAPPRDLRAEIPPRLDTLIQRCVALDPVYRPSDDSEIIEGLRLVRKELEQRASARAKGNSAAGNAPKVSAWEMMSRRRPAAGVHSELRSKKDS